MKIIFERIKLGECGCWGFIYSLNEKASAALPDLNFASQTRWEFTEDSFVSSPHLIHSVPMFAIPPWATKVDIQLRQ
jgi:hypothetical protein